ncbi:E3 ubiquitin-protein ligase BIG BROTHER-like [Prosopis cineraria]|uniref:E3 ubiquitin-protein ligase BIG BROTHER-like n=1 Tax=Prosopis cineraria TaxID=364024 RepID=UPI00241071A6|nr:E3 ubiquitin-protein ligase BIG BROTHER-like [Prosopis cineraria]XP_054811595.1 E3 ubiquitin-protein ligase BIG BROTHER-like [Prosopis cineraria]XP_054811596.1 E3 ubiquitin-protein ligase BIG BROTHER-like [Prosopis cineraria]XP_054811597.1 E3 ubiquitin-protein ligase BIG BROTHER-like [Prosopis cineraria]XP_054811598.1 E3 ubiquitin-protein ligase BIG BROTHER-like [Prosopis cineraria]XP_054811599.1 E3 ubiquitin-protein ligase BIG BROTHER-like [Prosopis cineraria]
MNYNRPMEVHYIDTGFPYTVTESFMDFFEGITYMPANCLHTGSMPDQESANWMMNMSPYKYDMSGPLCPSYFGYPEYILPLPRVEVYRGQWENPSTMTVEEPATTDTFSRGDGVAGMQTIPEECSPNHQDATSTQVAWQQDSIDPDNMTYEELLDLGEAVGTQSRGLSKELIDLLPVSKYKFRSMFKRKKYGKRCVICQMTYKRGDQQMKLPCTHVYHSECISKWLSINKKCPVCNAEVFCEDSRN